MDTKGLMTYALTKPCAYADMPFGDGNVLIKVGKHYFASFFVLSGKECMTVKGEADYHTALRSKYPEYVYKGWHCPPVQAKYNSTVVIDSDIPYGELVKMIDVSYEYNLSKFSKKEKERFCLD